MNNENIYYKDKNGNDEFGISFQQYSIIIINTLFKNRVPLYHFIRLTGKIDLHKLEKSIQALYDTYDALRIRVFNKNKDINIFQFNDIGNFPNDCNYYQKVLLNYDYKLSVIQSNGENSEDKLAYAKSEFIKKITEYKSIINTNPLDISIYNIGVDDYLLCFSVDHLVSDGISVNMLIYSIFDYYKNGFLSNKPSKMFVEYVEQINSLYKTDEGTKKYQFYQDLIKDVVQLTIPPTNNSDFDLNNNGELIKSFDKKPIEKTAQINRTSVNNVVTLSLLLGIAKYFKNNDICIGSAFANRNSLENRNIVGLLATGFINRYVFNPTESYKDALKHLMNITGKNSKLSEGFQGDVIKGVNLYITYISDFTNMSFQIPDVKVELLVEEYHRSAVEIGNGVFLSFVESFNKIQLINGFNPKDISASAINEIMQNTELALNQIINNPNGNPYDFIYD